MTKLLMLDAGEYPKSRCSCREGQTDLGLRDNVIEMNVVVNQLINSSCYRSRCDDAVLDDADADRGTARRAGLKLKLELERELKLKLDLCCNLIGGGKRILIGAGALFPRVGYQKSVQHLMANPVPMNRSHRYLHHE